MARRAEAERNDRALLEAAREVIAVDGAHTSVASIAARAGVGIGSLYRRYSSKTALFQHLVELALDQWTEIAEQSLADDDPWNGLVHYISSAVGSGSLAPLAGMVTFTDAMTEKNTRSDKAFEALIDRAHRAGVLRRDVTAVDVLLLVEQLSKSPLIEHLQQQGRDDLLDAARNAQRRVIAIAVAGLRPSDQPMPGAQPTMDLFTERWTTS
ncbi:TetR/AcrR family transcriptional regulator [Kibdelosporangium phytohabitans]|uniref:TetR family transcriptional regulator n=1 Tax=Kibdelosporangium phytohabitans TaxID=860235 RepID=A0A0N9HVB2_9PSEU|nr:TetR/AcrR family transcriptional regulator [Kibdelosporangium phytohabitans]ALG09004.1 TetR family transcriptional regulator [Kibdelosporangium phytohabitans]MBE1469818.1 AcrR family transcriptional regulator [Kibdelosporangium phytohabitans]